MATESGPAGRPIRNHRQSGRPLARSVDRLNKVASAGWAADLPEREEPQPLNSYAVVSGQRVSVHSRAARSVLYPLRPYPR